MNMVEGFVKLQIGYSERLSLGTAQLALRPTLERTFNNFVFLRIHPKDSLV